MIIGQAPSRTSDPAEVLRGKSGEKLRTLLGVSVPKFARIVRVNLSTVYDGKDGKGDAFTPDPDLVLTALAIAHAHDVALVLGKAAARALKLPKGIEYFIPTLRKRTTFYVVPHPSGINRWWNATANRKIAERFFGGITAWEEAKRKKMKS